MELSSSSAKGDVSLDPRTQLKNILVGPELNQIKSWQKTAGQILKKVEADDQIVDTMGPLVPELLKKGLDRDKERAELIKIIQSLMPEVLSELSPEQLRHLASIGAPIVSQSITAQLKKERSQIIDALYPVIGSMIYKYISETFKEFLEKIEEKVQRQVSYKSYIRKVRSRVTGIPESELLFKESLKPKLRSVFLIHSHTGIVLADAHRSGSETNQRDMIGGMLTAITSFVNDWIEKSGEIKNIDTIEYGDSQILVESAGSYYMAAVAEGVGGTLSLRRSMRRFLMLVQQGESSVISNLEEKGSAGDIDSRLKNFFVLEDETEKFEKKRNRRHLVFGVAIVALVFLGTGGWNLYKKRDLTRQIQAVLEKDIFLGLYRLKAEAKDPWSIQVDGAVPDSKLIDRAESLIFKSNPEIQNIDLKNVQVLRELGETSLTSRVNNIFSEKLNRLWGISLVGKFVSNELLVFGVVSDAKKYEQVESFLERSFLGSKINNLTYVDPSFFDLEIPFKVNQVSLSKEDYDILNKLTKLLRRNKILGVEIQGFSDFHGRWPARVYVGRQRAWNIRQRLIDRGILPERIRVVWRSFGPSQYWDDYPQKKNQRVVRFSPFVRFK